MEVLRFEPWMMGCRVSVSSCLLNKHMNLYPGFDFCCDLLHLCDLDSVGHYTRLNILWPHISRHDVPLPGILNGLHYFIESSQTPCNIGSKFQFYKWRIRASEPVSKSWSIYSRSPVFLAFFMFGRDRT